MATKKELYRMINEQISEFDFLSMDNSNAESERDTILNSKDFQTSLIIDLINDFNNKNKFKKMSITFVNKDVDMFDQSEIIEAELDLTYSFNEKDYDLIFFIDGYRDGDNIPYNDFELKIFSKAGDQIKFDWIEKNEKLYNTLIKEIVSPLVK